MPEIEVRCIFDEEDERAPLCQILVPLVPNIQGDGQKMLKFKQKGEEKGEEKVRRWKVWSRKRGTGGGGRGGAGGGGET